MGRDKKHLKSHMIRYSVKKKKELYFKALEWRAEVFNFIGKTEDALSDVNLLISLLEMENDKKNLGYALTLKGNILGCQEKFDSMEEVIEKARSIFKKIKDRRAEAATLITSSRYYELIKNYKKALKLCKTALEILKGMKDKKEISNGFNNLGSIYHSMGDYDKAFFYYKKGLNIRREINDKRGESESLNNIAFAYEDINNYKMAMQYYSDSLKIRREIGYKRGEVITLINMAYLFKKTGKFSKAVSCLEQSSSLARNGGMQFELGRSLYELARILCCLPSPANYIKAEGYLKEAEKIFRKVGAEMWLKKIEKLWEKIENTE